VHGHEPTTGGAQYWAKFRLTASRARRNVLGGTKTNHTINLCAHVGRLAGGGRPDLDRNLASAHGQRFAWPNGQQRQQFSLQCNRSLFVLIAPTPALAMAASDWPAPASTRPASQSASQSVSRQGRPARREPNVNRPVPAVRLGVGRAPLAAAAVAADQSGARRPLIRCWPAGRPAGGRTKR
jgi:hypothetical protein